MKSHYEKIIVTCCFLSLFVNIGLNSTSFAVYQPYIVSMPDIGDAAGSIILSTRILVSAVATMLVNHPEIAECDINPLIVHEQGKGCSVADARIMLRKTN